MTENKNVETILKNGDKALSRMPYLYRSKGLPSEVYDVRMRKGINGELLKLAIADTVIRYPYFGVRFIEKDGDFYAARNMSQTQKRKGKLEFRNRLIFSKSKKQNIETE